MPLGREAHIFLQPVTISTMQMIRDCWQVLTLHVCVSVKNGGKYFNMYLWHLLKKDKSWSWSRRRRTNFRLTTAKWEFSWKSALFKDPGRGSGRSWYCRLPWKAVRLVSALKIVVADHLQTLSNGTFSVCIFKMATPFIRLAGCLECNPLLVSKSLPLLG